jgi:hypothetical protein
MRHDDRITLKEVLILLGIGIAAGVLLVGVGALTLLN